MENSHSNWKSAPRSFSTKTTRLSRRSAKRRRQRVVSGVSKLPWAGRQSRAKLDPVLATSWRISFNPPAKTGGVVQVSFACRRRICSSQVLVGRRFQGVEIAFAHEGSRECAGCGWGGGESDRRNCVRGAESLHCCLLSVQR